MPASCYMIYGPPGAGKSTLLQHLPQQGRCVAIDLELVGVTGFNKGPGTLEIARAARRALVRQLTQIDYRAPLFFGCANLGPEDFPADSRIIYLHHPDFEHYMAWADMRNRLQPNAANQDYAGMHAHMTRHMEEGMYDFVIQPAEYPGRPDEMARHVWSLVKARDEHPGAASSPVDAQAEHGRALDDASRPDPLIPPARRRHGQWAERKMEDKLSRMHVRHMELKHEHYELKRRHRELDRQFKKTFRSRLVALRARWRELRKGGGKPAAPRPGDCPGDPGGAATEKPGQATAAGSLSPASGYRDSSPGRPPIADET